MLVQGATGNNIPVAAIACEVINDVLLEVMNILFFAARVLWYVGCQVTW